jgi:hypothetical protein
VDDLIAVIQREAHGLDDGRIDAIGDGFDILRRFTLEDGDIDEWHCDFLS